MMRCSSKLRYGTHFFDRSQGSDSILYTKNKDGESVPSFVIDQVSVALSPFQTLAGALGLSIDADLLGGTVSVDISGDSFQPSETDITTDITGWTSI